MKYSILMFKYNVKIITSNFSVSTEMKNVQEMFNLWIEILNCFRNCQHSIVKSLTSREFQDSFTSVFHTNCQTDTTKAAESFKTLSLLFLKLSTLILRSSLVRKMWNEFLVQEFYQPGIYLFGEGTCWRRWN